MKYNLIKYKACLPITKLISGCLINNSDVTLSGCSTQLIIFFGAPLATAASCFNVF